MDTYDAYVAFARTKQKLTRQETGALFVLYRKAPSKALEAKIVEGNLRLVIFYAERFRRYKLPMMDLVQEGNIGLLRALRKFDVTRGVTFGTYAAYWIFVHLNHFVKKFVSPVYVASTHVGIADLPRSISMAAPAQFGFDGEEFGDRLVDTALPVDEQVDTAREYARVRAAVQAIKDPVHRTVAHQRLIMEDRTLSDIGDFVGVSRERIRQIENIILDRKLPGLLRRHGIDRPQIGEPRRKRKRSNVA